MRVLLVEDDVRLGAALGDVLRGHGMEVDHAVDAAEAMEALQPGTDAVVLDLGLPDHDGFEVCTRIRRTHDVPVLMATARGDLASRVHGLNLGADDYLVKPYDVRELLARLHAITRRRRPAEPVEPVEPVVDAPMCAAGLAIDPLARSVHRGAQEISLTRKEFDLLALLAGEPGVVFRREQIASQVWASSWEGCSRTMEVHVASIRAKAGAAVIETVRGVGYRVPGG